MVTAIKAIDVQSVNMAIFFEENFLPSALTDLEIDPQIQIESIKEGEDTLASIRIIHQREDA